MLLAACYLQHATCSTAIVLTKPITLILTLSIHCTRVLAQLSRMLVYLEEYAVMYDSGD